MQSITDLFFPFFLPGLGHFLSSRWLHFFFFADSVYFPKKITIYQIEFGRQSGKAAFNKEVLEA